MLKKEFATPLLLCVALMSLFLWYIFSIWTPTKDAITKLDAIRSEVENEYNEKIDYALENDFSFYLDGEDVTHKIENMDIEQYDVSFEK